MQETQERNTRERIVDGAESALIELGIAHTTTKEVARRAEISEPTIYLYFASKQALLETVTRERLLLPSLNSAVLDQDVGPPDEILTRFLESLFDEYARILPMYSAVLADARLTAALRAEPPTFAGFERVSSWLEGQQDVGGVRKDADAQVLARLMFGTAFHHALLDHAFGEEALGLDRDAVVRGLVELALPTP